MTTASLSDSQTLAQRSIRLIVELQTEEGAYPASPTFSAYRGYSWFRDGSFIADAASAAGAADSAARFFDWCASVLTSRRDHIRWIVEETRAGRPPAAQTMLPARFAFDGSDGTDEWWDFQLDGYGTWLWALATHLERHGAAAERWSEAIDLTVDYLVASWSRPCYDWWEEHAEQVHVSTLACVSAGLSAVSELVDGPRRAAIADAVSAIDSTITEQGVTDGRLSKWIGSDAVDGSLAAAIAPLGVVDATSDLGHRTIATLKAHLDVDGGVHRYLGDTFFGGGQWPLLSCFLGLAHLAAGDDDAARTLYDWAASTATPAGDLPEQVDHHLIAPGMQQEWIDRWGTVATPLLWSHAMYLRLGLALGELTADDLTASVQEVTR